MIEWYGLMFIALVGNAALVALLIVSFRNG
ncbi:hypothetical protein ACVWW6_005541 [Bradyrhizobium sp. USDA 3311]